ncbi:MAG: hypothetical protein OXI93_18060 [Bryobacterales bacterium]|nr:hypothetical protein [Bryobacterales bacterium]
MASARKTVSFRCDRAFFDRMVEASNNHRLSLSEWMRRALEETVEVQLPRSVSNGWKEAILEEGERGAFFAGNTGKLPENLVGEAIEAVTDQGITWTGVIDEVRFRTHRIVIVKVRPRVARSQVVREEQPTAVDSGAV